jgi:hypothetical protein
MDNVVSNLIYVLHRATQQALPVRQNKGKVVPVLN